MYTNLIWLMQLIFFNEMLDCKKLIFYVLFIRFLYCLELKKIIEILNEFYNILHLNIANFLNGSNSLKIKNYFFVVNILYSFLIVLLYHRVFFKIFDIFRRVINKISIF